jgi:hypothetical protein
LANATGGDGCKHRRLRGACSGTPEQASRFDDRKQHLTVPVRLKGVRVERSRRSGDVYLALALWRNTGTPSRPGPTSPAQSVLLNQRLKKVMSEPPLDKLTLMQAD